MPNTDLKKEQPVPVVWIIWFAILQGALVIQWVIGEGIPEGENAAESMDAWLWLIVFIPIILAIAIRWLIIPKLDKLEAKMTAMIAGLALAEAPIMLSLFLMLPDYPQNQIAVLMVGVVAIFQFAPFYAKRNAGGVSRSERSDKTGL
ncbi:hypothetical protein DDZ13_10910 [Coraliomargarita sinensis]|uniref:Uncharacterized protein n=1 Tax=Coraliomargarita sinensis TaxID=2174842 RepID=A0A317ZIR5_9BACT|nr:hypothetical protein [Coraliomargarita sinensis]PXA03788.1 hypothetical protein DDZ13_10910 [Coraliomargarita sinensis]